MTPALIVLIFVAFCNAELLIFPDEYERASTMFAAAPVRAYSPPALSASPQTQNLGEYWSDRVNNLISRGIAKFTLDMDNAIFNSRRQMANGTLENVVFSPLSLAGTMTMVLLGSSGKTFDEVSRILGFEVEVDISKHSEIVHQIFGLLLSSVSENVNRPSAPRVNYASGIFVQEGFPIRPEFRTISEVVYKSEVRNLDFARKGQEAQVKVNSWVAEKTMGKISSILSDVPPPVTRVIIASALYFKGEWNQHFIQSGTKRKQFFIEPGRSVNVDMMYNGGNFPFYEDKNLGANIIALPYKNFEMSMYVILPSAKGAAALKNFKSRLTADILENLISNMKNETCIIGFPRMKISSTLRLREAFESLGLRSLFSPTTADLSLLSPGYGETNISPLTPRPPPTQTPSSLTQTPTNYPQASSGGNDYRYPSLPQQDDDVLIFSRFGDDNGTTSNDTRRGRIRYRVDDYIVDRWDSGFTLKKIGAQQRTASGNTNQPRRKRNSTMKGRNPRKIFRKKRQQRPIDQAFVDFMRTRNFQSFGLDDIRNSGLTKNPGLYADEVFHKTVMDVTETGTEAAAATAVSIYRDARCWHRENIRGIRNVNRKFKVAAAARTNGCPGAGENPSVVTLITI